MATPTSASGTTSRLGWAWIAATGLATVPGVVHALGAFGATPPVSAVLYGVAILGAAFLLSWVAEAVQIDLSQGLALALLALIAILPEYVVDASFAWLAAEDPAYAGYAIANMTGANRLLIGIAWPLVVVLAYLRFRRRFVELEEGHGLELVVLLAATLYAFILPFKGTLKLARYGGACRHVCLLPLADRAAASRAAAPGGSGPDNRGAADGAPADDHGGPGCGGGRGDPARGQAVRPGPGGDGRDAGDRRVPARAVARPAGLGSPRVRGGGPLRLARPEHTGAWGRSSLPRSTSGPCSWQCSRWSTASR